nr:sigma-70 family RNA polymerase sigma factor [Rhodopirellula sp. SM50]
MADDSFRDPNCFPTTRWSIVRRAGDRFDADQSAALQELLTRYWSALKTHLVKSRQIQSSDADDLVQGFIEHKILERNLLSVAEPSRGRFRSLLVHSLDNYAKNQLAKRRAKKRSADHALSMPGNDVDVGVASTPDTRADHAFDVQWARTVLADASDRMQQECLGSNRETLWLVFHGRILAPIYEGAEPISYSALVDRFAFRSPAQASNALMTGKRMFARSLRLVISQYVHDEQEIEQELAELQDIVSQP